MPSAASLLPWVLTVLAFVPGLILAATWRSRIRITHLPLVALALGAAVVLPLAAAQAAEVFAAPGLILLDRLAFLLGAVVVSLAGLLHQWTDEDSSADAALVGCGAILLVFMSSQEGVLASLTALSALLGMASAALAWAYLGYRRAMVQALVAGAALLPAGALAAFQKNPDAKLGVAVAGLLAVGTALVSLAGPKGKGLPPLISCLVLVGASGILAGVSGGSLLGSVGIILAASGVVALIQDFAIPRENGRPLLAALLWLAAAAYAFSSLGGLGVALMALGGGASLLLLKRADLLATLAPLLAFSLYRVFREASEGTARTFDIGHHYGMMGFLVGLLAVETVATTLKGTTADCIRPTTKGIAGALFLFFLLIGAGLILQDRGVAGLLMGTGLAAVLSLSHGRGSSLASAGLGIGSATLLALSFKVLLPFLDVSRDSKQLILAAMAVGTLASLAALVFIARPKTEAHHENSLA